jgi:hypothetical protein
MIWYLVYTVISATTVTLVHSNTRWCLYIKNRIRLYPERTDVQTKRLRREEVGARLKEDRGSEGSQNRQAVKYCHVLSDYRRSLDW